MRQKQLIATPELEYLIQEPLAAPYRILAKPEKRELTEKELETLVNKIINVNRLCYLFPRKLIGFEEVETGLYVRENYSLIEPSLPTGFLALVNYEDFSFHSLPDFLKLNPENKVLITADFIGAINIDIVKNDLAIMKNIYFSCLSYQKNNLKNALKSYQVGMSTAMLSGFSTSYITESLVPALVGAGLGLALFFLKRVFGTPKKIVNDANQLSFSSKHYFIGLEQSHRICIPDYAFKDYVIKLVHEKC